MTIFLVASVSAGDLNESTALENDSSLDEGVISVEESQDDYEDLSLDDAKLGAYENQEILSTNYTPKTSSEIQSCVDSAKDGDTIIFDGYYLINSTIDVCKKLNLIGVNDATIDGNKSIRLFNLSTTLSKTLLI